MDMMKWRLEKGPSYGERVFVGKNTVIIGDVYLGNDVSIWCNCVLRGDVERIFIDDNSVVQDGSIFHVSANKYPVHIGKKSSIGHSVSLHGCVIGDNTLVGIGSIILDGVHIGSNSIVGAGCLVPSGSVFDDNSVIMGNPARVVREATPQDMEYIANSVKAYTEYKNLYLSMKL